MLLKSIKHMQVHIIQYRNAGDDEIETFGITSHRWSRVDIYKYLQVDPGSKRQKAKGDPLLFWSK